MINVKIPKTQHYVPQFVLKRFVTAKNKQIWVFDKRTGKKFRTSIKNIASENGFYDFEFEGHKLTLEVSLSKVDSQASKVIKKIVQNESLAVISNEEKHFLAQFLAIQFVRTRQLRETFRDFNELIPKALQNRGLKQEDIQHFVDTDESNIIFQHIRSIEDFGTYVPYFLDKIWILFKTNIKNPFYISDNPIVLQNFYTYGPLSNIGLAIKGIEIYFPLTNTLSLAMWCPSHEDTIKMTREQYKNLYEKNPRVAKLIPYDPTAIEQLMTGMEKGEVVQFNYDNVINHNSLQVIFSYRYVYSNTDDFSLAEEMIDKHPELCFGPKIQVN